MRRKLPFLLFCISFCIAFVRHAGASEIRCLDPDAVQKAHPDHCSMAGLTGKITPGDSELLEVFFKSHGNAMLYLNSPGGDFFEGLRLGRVLRRHLSEVRASDITAIADPNLVRCGIEGKPVCCASACALAYFGGGAWAIYDKLGLHRATARDVKDQSLSDVKRVLSETSMIVKEYLEDMEVEAAAFDAMAAAPPDSLNVYTVGETLPPDVKQNSYEVYPASIRDWISSKCKMIAGANDPHDCMWHAFLDAKREAGESLYNVDIKPALEKMNPIEIVDEIKLILREIPSNGQSPKTILDLPPMYNFTPRGRYQLKRLDELRLSQESDRISSMNVCQASAYLKGHRGEGGRPLLGEGRTFDVVIDRLTKLTGVEEYWDERNQNPAGCSQ